MTNSEIKGSISSNFPGPLNFDRKINVKLKRKKSAEYY